MLFLSMLHQEKQEQMDAKVSELMKQIEELQKKHVEERDCLEEKLTARNERQLQTLNEQHQEEVNALSQEWNNERKVKYVNIVCISGIVFFFWIM